MQDPTAILSNPIMPSCQLPDVAFRGSMVYWYNSTSFRDDLAWAASWMYKATGDPDYLGDAYGFWDTHKMLEGDYDIRYLVSFMPAVQPSVLAIVRPTLRARREVLDGGSHRESLSALLTFSLLLISLLLLVLWEEVSEPSSQAFGVWVRAR